MTVHLLVDGYRVIACRDGEGVPPGDKDTSAVTKVTCLSCLERALKLYEAKTVTIARRLVELGGTKL